jgi:hypothetical protein
MEGTHLMGHEHMSYEPPHPRLFNMPVAPVAEKSNFTVYQAPTQPPFAITPALSRSSPPPALNSGKRRRTEEASASQETSRSMSDVPKSSEPFPPQFSILPVPENQSYSSTLYASQTPIIIRATPSQVSLQPATPLESRKREREREQEQELSLPPPNTPANQPRETEIYAEIQALVGQEVMRARYGPLFVSLTSEILRRRGNWRLSTLSSHN